MKNIEFEKREIPNDENLKAEARKKPSGFVYEIDWQYPEGRWTPPEAIKGGWKVDQNGNLTGDYWTNELYRAIESSHRQPPSYILELNGVGIYDEWCVEVAQEYGDEVTFPDYPEHTKVGSWYIDKSGNVTNLFRPNPKYIPKENK